MAADIKGLLDAGKLDEAIEAMNAEVRAKPTDVNARAGLVELLCYAGNLERADKLLDAISSLDPSTALGIALYRQLVRAEQARGQFYLDGRVPEFLSQPDAVSQLEMRAAVLMRDGDAAGALQLLAERDALHPPVTGEADGVAFDDFRDLDDLNATHLEVLTATGKYYWVPLSIVTAIELRPPERRRDLLWRRANLCVTEGPDGEVYLPAIYWSAQATPEQRLGHTTDFEGGEDAPIRGLGLRSFLVGDDSRTLLELGTVKFANPGA
ncbi:type VI secretion system accessory protein TagJ [Caulobacter sp. KR2-114]|uniref:type VI secretion system accessory protein TagJ n=1 Tax=Caulobacter sp. KR2-114 TaxID=3400912 RepID=UPI003C01049B